MGATLNNIHPFSYTSRDIIRRILILILTKNPFLLTLYILFVIISKLFMVLPSCNKIIVSKVQDVITLKATRNNIILI